MSAAPDQSLIEVATELRDKALEAEPELRPRIEAGMSVLRQRAADQCMDEAERAIAAGDLTEAEALELVRRTLGGGSESDRRQIVEFGGCWLHARAFLRLTNLFW